MAVRKKAGGGAGNKPITSILPGNAGQRIAGGKGLNAQQARRAVLKAYKKGGRGGGGGPEDDNAIDFKSSVETGTTGFAKQYSKSPYRTSDFAMGGGRAEFGVGKNKKKAATGSVKPKPRRPKPRIKKK